jgi:protein required for attachment to host cells
LKKNRNGSAELDLMMISHIDSDHIAGILDLTDELIEAEEESSLPLVKINETWHNSFVDTIVTQTGVKKATVREESLELADIAGSDPIISNQMINAKAVLSSVSQGRRLRNDLGRLKIPLNKGFTDNIVLKENQQKVWKKQALSLTVIGPGQQQLDKLRKAWAKQLPKILSKEKDKEAALAATSSLDRSVFNLASIVVIAEVNNIRMLFTGDARGDMILEWLFDSRPDEKTHFDLIKLPHHGSDRNVSPDFFSRVTADHYIMSGNGKHGNPEPETFEMLFNARPELDYKVHLTYSPEELKDHHDFDNQAFKKVLNRDPHRQQCLRFPNAEDSSIVLKFS